MEDSSGVAIVVPCSRDRQDVFTPDSHIHDMEEEQEQHKQAADSLIQVIEKLSKIVEKRPRQCTLSGKKRPSMTCASVMVADSREGNRGVSPSKRTREHREDCQDLSCAPVPITEQDTINRNAPMVTCYQCSLCRFLSPTLNALKEHMKQHDEQHNDLILMCSECCFTSNHQKDLEAHVRLHFEDGDYTERSPAEQQTGSVKRNLQGRIGYSTVKSEPELEKMPRTPKKWYRYEQGRYHCLICSYECGQQRNLKTHAWKHAGLVDCSYPIFEDDADQHEAHPLYTLTSHPSLALCKKREDVVVLAPFGEQAQVLRSARSIQLELCASASVKYEGDAVSERVEELKNPMQSVFSVEGALSEEPIREVQVTPEAQMELELETENQQMSTDSLLSSVQKIISSSGNSAGHVNVIVERLPCSEEPVTSQPLLLSPEASGYKTLLASQEVGTERQSHPLFCEEQVLIDWNGSDEHQEIESQETGPPPEDSVPPVRRRTHSECLRLHSLAAEALVAMPLRAPELSKSTVKGTSSVISDTGQKIIDLSTASAVSNAKVPSAELVAEMPGSTTLLNLSHGSREGIMLEGPSKAGISISLLTVIERLRERADQNASDEDVLRELQDNPQLLNGTMATGEVDVADDSSTPEADLVEYIAGSDRPYRCRLCLYSSGNKGYVKQHLRVHRQRHPYQCPICKHIALDSSDLESHMIHHRKSRMYQCKHCPEIFHYKSQLRDHERAHQGISDTAAALTPVGETKANVDESMMTEEDCFSEQKVYKCDMCDYTSSTYVGVRNHRRIHSSDKPYRCCSCDFATTNMNSLKSHMKRHPQEHQAVQLLEQYRCSLCGYVCSHPPSLKSHMWKHAGDQNYNYEQVNRAINEAMSQSSRSPVVPSKSGLDPSADRSYIILNQKEKTSRPSAQRASGLPVRKGGTGVPNAALEYCMLLFCCPVCSFESTSKEQLMEHMKEHDFISIILSKEQQGR
ncbi:zinc finger protein 507 [Tachysurus vachellii]|uniref:zinc finger protein 507 n=1 Tax=Tachysurus vachellii TaxID=175792 RepID=UPI00296B1899|nr:zinc finger protein 507 [Tachysurus vachellii]XP_060715484.1 zinc finger protein 507 [Tachysurus vachellii]